MSENIDLTPELNGREQQIAVLGSWNQIGNVIYVLSELRIADCLSSGPSTAEQLAALTTTNPSALRRVLRCAAAVGILAEDDDGRFTLTRLGDGLRSDQLGGLRPMALFSAADHVRRSYAEILHSVRTGEPAFDRVFGMSFYEYLRVNPDIGRSFAGFMAHWSRQLSERYADNLGLERFSRIADIGGGDGYFLARILRDHQASTGELFELPQVAERAKELIAEQGITHRVHIVGGDFFTDPLPERCDAYLLKSILHDWRDGEATAILRSVRKAIGDVDSRLIVIDQIVPSSNQWDHAKVIDIDMLVLFGGKERTLSEWSTLFAEGGFELAQLPTGTGWITMECRPR